jgi:hypothetical protein
VTLFSLENIYRQYLACRRGKRNTANALRFETRQEQELLALREALARPFCLLFCQAPQVA